MAQPFDICIRGSGIVGRALALLLARDRFTVALVDTAADTGGAHTDVRAYALNAASRAVLESLRCWPDAPHTTPVLRMEVHGDHGGDVHFSAAEQQVAALAWIADVPALEARLADAVRFQPRIASVPSPVPAPLTVVCEGRASHTRNAWGIAHESFAYPQTAVATRARCQLPHGQAARQWFSPSGDILALLPLGGMEGQEVAVVWSVAAERAGELLSMAPDAFSGTMQAACANALGTFELQGERRAWPLQLSQARRWCGALPDGQAWVLAGDAAHTVHPLSGQGLNLGLGDAHALASLLTTDNWRSVSDLRTLRQYERARKTALVPMRISTDALAQLFALPQPMVQNLRNWGMQAFDRSGPLKAWMARQAMNLELGAATSPLT